MASYIYDPIDLAQPTIRLARLLRGEGDDIQCEIFQAWLNRPEDLIPYEALSYTWGNTELTDNVKINESQLSVTQNLYLALRYLRFKNQDRILWIDGLCIDQDNDTEKGHQVRQMGDIYHRAERVVIWLGQATYETNVLMDSMKLLEEECINHSRNISEQARREIWLNIQPMLLKIHPNLEVRQHSGLESLFGRSWFKRVWIVQEVANARAAIVVCGAKSVSARTFALVPPLIEIKLDLHCQSILDIMPGRSREESWWSKKRDLQTLLLKFGKSEASDPRDNIYALLGLSSDACDSDLLRADYSKTVPAIMVDTALFFLRNPELRHTGFQLYWNIPQFLMSVRLLSNVVLRSGQYINEEHFVALLLARDDIEVNSKDENGDTLLHIAVKVGDMELIGRLLARQDIDINSEDKNGGTPLQIAVKRKAVGGESVREKVVRLLLTRDDIDVNWKDKDGKSPLQLAIENGAEVEAELLLMRDDIKVDSKDENGKSLLRVAVENRNSRIALKLLRVQDFDVNSKDENGKSLLHIAVETRADLIVRELLQCHEIDLSSKDENGTSLLHVAVEKRSLSLVKKLLEFRQIDVNWKNKDGISPLHRAVANKDVWVVRYLLASKGIDVNLEDKDGMSPLHTAIVNRDILTVKELLASKGIDVNLKDNDDISPLDRAVEYWDDQVVGELLASKGVDVNLKGLSDEALRWMASYNFVNQEIVDSQEILKLPVPQRRKRKLSCIVM